MLLVVRKKGSHAGTAILVMLCIALDLSPPLIVIQEDAADLWMAPWNAPMIPLNNHSFILSSGKVHKIHLFPGLLIA